MLIAQGFRSLAWKKTTAFPIADFPCQAKMIWKTPKRIWSESIALKKGFVYRQIMNLELQNLREKGILSYIEKKYKSKSIDCHEDEDTTISEISMKKVIFLIIIILTFSLASIIIFVTEVFHGRIISKYKSVGTA